MTSSMLAGERRWASARRGGMTVLGKVAVPKPINLPSQKLENHGLDPNVEIVPKGSLSWGSRPSSSASNPWGSSPSPSGDCSSGSPSHVGGRPSSGGSGTRPSTAGSDRMHEPSPSAWGSNSRPSSASGALTSNQTSLTPLRPQSAETRPGSSQLSRFAEHLPDSSVAWGPTGNVDKLTVASTKNDDFSLSSGDFPTLGSERDNCGKNSVSQDYGSHDRPMSSSGEVAPANDGTVTSESNVEAGGTNTWKRDDASHPDDGVQPNSNNWQGGYPQQFMNTNAPPQHFDAWHGPSMNSPAGVWYSGPPGGPPYGPPVAPGGFPLEPFPYYRPQMPPPALGNSQPVPEQLSVAGPRGHHPKNGDLYRPQIPESYMHPGMPVRPGFYPRPVPYDNYYRPPMGYCNPNERDIPFMGMSAGPPIFNRYPGQNTPDHSNTHVRAGGHGSNATTLISEQVESGNRDDSRGPYKVLTKQHNDLDAQGEKGSWDNTVPGNVSFPGKGGQPRATFRKNEWGADGRREEMQSRRTALGEYSSSRRFDDGGRHSLNSARVKSPEIVDHAKSVDQSWGKKSENVSSHFPEIPRVVTATPKDSTLLQKIEGLNAKARASDGRLEVPLASSREEQKSVSQYDTAKSNNSMNEVGTAACSERPNAGDFIHVSGEAAVSKGHMIRQAGTAISRRAHNGVEGIVEHRGKGRINTTGPDGWRKKPLGAEYFTANPTTNVGPVSILHNQDHHIHAEVVGTPETSLPGKDEGESLTLMLDSSDTHAQRAKMRELAKQRAIQLQREEEERIREQKAKALAKLEELNRRTLAGDGLTQNLEKTPVSVIIADQEDSETLAELVKIGPKNEASNSILDLSPRVGEPTSIGDTSIVAETIILSKNSHMDTSKIEEQGTSSSQPSSLELHAYSASTGAVDVKAAPEINNNSSSKHMPTGYKQNQSIQVEKPFSETLISFGTIGLPNIHEILVVGTLPETVPKEIVPNNDSTLSDNSNMVPKLSTTQGKKVTKSSKNKSKLEKPVSASQLQVSRQPHSDRASFEIGKYKASQTELDPGSVQSAEDLQQASEQHSLLSEESQIKVNTQRKSQPSRRVSRSGQSNKMADRSHGNDATIWAPVRSHNKAEAADEVDRKSLPDSVAVTANSNNLGQSNPKGKRAEMERYVPKPVAKEHAQQGILQISVSSSVSQTTPDENTGRKDSSFQRNESSQPPRSVVENVGRKLESNTGDSKQSRQGKARGGWKEHGSTESSRVQTGSYLSSNSSKNIHKYMDQQEYSISDVNQVADPNFPNGWDPSDGWNMPEEPSAAVTVSIGMKDQGGLKGKGKRHPYKSHRSMANKHDLDQKNSSGGEMYKKQNQSAAPETSQAERNVTAKESRGNGEKAASLWQPKSQAYSAYSPTGSRSSGGQHVSADTGRATKKDSPPEGCEDVPQLHLDQSVSRNKCVGESMNVVHQEGRREKKVASGKECPQAHKHGLVDMDELTLPESESVDTRFEQRSSSGFRKHGNQNKSVKGRELREDWSSVGQDSRHQNVHGNRERQPRNSHYEYQPVGPYNHGSSHNFEGPTDGSHNMGSRYRERGQGQGQGQGQSRRGGGNSYGRKSGVIQVDAGYD